MALFPSARALITSGILRMLRGMRTGDQQTLILGAAITAWGWWRRVSGPTRTLLHRETLRPGQSLVIRERGDHPEQVRVIKADG